jgi:hypothetical protein
VDELKSQLEIWNREVCETRLIGVNGKVGRTSMELFEWEELPALKSLPLSHWEPVCSKKPLFFLEEEMTLHLRAKRIGNTCGRLSMFRQN